MSIGEMLSNEPRALQISPRPAARKAHWYAAFAWRERGRLA